VKGKGQPKGIRSSVVSTTKFQVEIGTKIQLILLILLRSVVHNGDALFEVRESSLASVLSCRLQATSGLLSTESKQPTWHAIAEATGSTKTREALQAQLLELLKVNVFCQDAKTTEDARGRHVFIEAPLRDISWIRFRHKVLHPQHCSMILRPAKPWMPRWRRSP